jgi:hypothetical protein
MHPGINIEKRYAYGGESDGVDDGTDSTTATGRRTQVGWEIDAAIVPEEGKTITLKEGIMLVTWGEVVAWIGENHTWQQQIEQILGLEEPEWYLDRSEPAVRRPSGPLSGAVKTTLGPDQVNLLLLSEPEKLEGGEFQVRIGKPYLDEAEPDQSTSSTNPPSRRRCAFLHSRRSWYPGSNRSAS